MSESASARCSKKRPMNILVAVLNSLWQATIVAAIVSLALRALPRTNASTRYAISLATLALLLVLPTVPTIVESLHFSAKSVPTTIKARAARSDLRAALTLDEPAMLR